MSHDWVARPHIRIPSENVRRSPRKRRQPPIKGKRKDPSESGKVLISQLEESVKYCNRPQKIIEDEDVLFIVHTEGPICFRERLLNRFGLRFSLQMDEYSAAVSADGQALEKFRNALKQYMETSKLRSYIDEISSISLIKFERISPELRKWLESSTSEAYVEIEILPNLEEDRYTSLIQKLVIFARKQGDKVVGSRIRESRGSLRAYLKPETVKTITQGVDSIWQARQAPKILTGKPQSAKIKERPIPRPPDSDAKSICILDTGVDRSHLLLENVVLDAVDLTSDNSAQDSDGHGTFVAGLAAYGELENRTDPKPSARIISAKVLGRDPSPYPYLESRVEEVVARFHTHAKIFNLSVMYPQYCNVSQPTDLAHTIDRLSKNYNVMFVICTGNVDEELPSLVGSLPYPTYLGDACCVIYGGAEACSAITVGGMANKDSDRSVAKVGEPSPFTRRGEVNKRAKPDVVSSAGNMEQAPETGDIRLNKEELGVTSLAVSPDILAHDVGTSYSAPVVANILARLSKEYPEADTNLLKALIIHFSYWPDQHFRLNASEDLKKALYGKGIPEFYQCAYSTKSSAAYVLEDSVGHDEIVWVPIYVPRIMRKIYGEKRMRVTLVYDPPVDRGILGYTLMDLDFQLYKQFRKQHNWDRVYRRKWDNVKTDVFRWQRAGWGKEWSLMIYPTVRFRDRIVNLGDVSQRFAVVVTLEDPNRKVNIYDAIINERKEKIQVPLEAFVQARALQMSSRKSVNTHL